MGDEPEQTKLSDSEKQEIMEMIQDIIEADRRLCAEELAEAVARFMIFTAKFALMYWIIRKCMK